jgi:hypothetical protein
MARAPASDRFSQNPAWRPAINYWWDFNGIGAARGEHGRCW